MSDKNFKIVAVVIAVISLSTVATAGYTIVHFVLKYW